jgi:hypothetical protein
LLQFERELDERIERLHQQLHETKRALDLEPENVQTKAPWVDLPLRI